MTGKYRWTREIPPAAEWFDLDRSEKNMSESEFYPPDADWTDHDSIEPICCPQCGSPILTYKGEAYDDDHHMGSAYECDECGLHFNEESLNDGTWQ